jgi:hypothetical protein
MHAVKLNEKWSYSTTPYPQYYLVYVANFVLPTSLFPGNELQVAI